MPLFRNALVAALISLSTCSAACQKPQVVTVPIPSPTCDPGPTPVFPRLAPEVCVDGEVELVCMTPADAAAIWAWARDMGRWSERARLCADTKDAPLPLVPDLGDVLFGADTVYRLPELARKVSDARVHIDVQLRECGFQNAFYNPLSRTILFCTEMLDNEPGAVRFFLAHEIAHAYIVQLDLPYTGSHEAAADELAAYLMIKAGFGDDLAAVAVYWAGADTRGEVPPYADHPANLQRAWTLGCLGLNSMGLTGPMCRNDLARINHNWSRILR